METFNMESNSPEQTAAWGTIIGQWACPGDVILFTGDLGSGKTTMTQGIARGLGYGGTVTSPTFTLIQEYDARMPIYHIDAYRLETEAEIHELGLEELYEADGLTLVEWSENLQGILPRNYVSIDLKNMGQGRRLITVGYEGSFGGRFYGKFAEELRGNL